MRRNGTIVQFTAEEASAMMARGEANIDRARLDAMNEEELEASIDYEEEGRFEDWVPIGDPLLPAGSQSLVLLDRDVVEWFAAQGSEYQSRMSQILRDYAETHQKAS